MQSATLLQRARPATAPRRSSAAGRGSLQVRAAHHRPSTVLLNTKPNEGGMLGWKDLAELAALEETYQVRAGAVPATVPTTTLPTSPDSTTTKPVLLYRDTNAWCPFCERVWMALEEKAIPYDTVLIDLRNKPDWYIDMVPSKLVPAARINGELVYESADILAKLEEEFPEAPLMPTDEEPKARAEELLTKVDAVTTAGYQYLTGGPFGKSDESKVPELKAEFEKQLGWLESELARVNGPFLCGEMLTLPDIMMVPAMERMSANLPRFRNFDMQDEETYPGVARWLEGIKARKSFKKISTDTETHNIIARKLFQVMPSPSLDGISDAELSARIEAAGKIHANKDAIIRDIVSKSGLSRTKASPYGRTTLQINGYMYDLSPAAVQSIDFHLRRVASYLVSNSVGKPAEDTEAAAVGAAAIAFFRNRATAPRDMSAAACTQLRAACDAVLRECF